MTNTGDIKYNIRDKNNKNVGYYTKSILRISHYKELLNFIPSSDFTIQSYGYNNREELWEGKVQKLDKFLEKVKNNYIW